MIDTSNVDLLGLIGQDTNLKRVASTNGGEYHGPCPFCGGTDRFVVNPNLPDGGRYWCRQCQSKGDAIAYVMEHDRLDFTEACQRLGLHLSDKPSPHFCHPPERRVFRVNAPGDLKNGYIALNDKSWQQAAKSFCENAHNLLWQDNHLDAHRYLRQRGLENTVYRAAGIGFNPKTHYAQWGAVEVWLPTGIVIPWKIGGDIWRINIRRFEGEPKYIQPKGCAPGLYGADAITLGCTVLMVEGEFDALAILSNTCQLPNLIPIATGPATSARLLRWIVEVDLADRVLLAFDADDAGDDAALWWGSQLGDKATRLRPTQHDVTDMWKVGENLEGWIASVS